MFLFIRLLRNISFFCAILHFIGISPISQVNSALGMLFAKCKAFLIKLSWKFWRRLIWLSLSPIQDGQFVSRLSAMVALNSLHADYAWRKSTISCTLHKMPPSTKEVNFGLHAGIGFGAHSANKFFLEALPLFFFLVCKIIYLVTFCLIFLCKLLMIGSCRPMKQVCTTLCN